MRVRRLGTMAGIVAVAAVVSACYPVATRGGYYDPYPRTTSGSTVYDPYFPTQAQSVVYRTSDGRVFPTAAARDAYLRREAQLGRVIYRDDRARTLTREERRARRQAELERERLRADRQARRQAELDRQQRRADRQAQRQAEYDREQRRLEREARRRDDLTREQRRAEREARRQELTREQRRAEREARRQEQTREQRRADREARRAEREARRQQEFNDEQRRLDREQRRLEREARRQQRATQRQVIQPLPFTSSRDERIADAQFWGARYPDFEYVGNDGTPMCTRNFRSFPCGGHSGEAPPREVK